MSEMGSKCDPIQCTSYDDSMTTASPLPRRSDSKKRFHRAKLAPVGLNPDFQRFSANGVLRCGIGPPLTTYTPREIRAIAIQSIAEGNSPRIGMPMRAVIAG